MKDLYRKIRSLEDDLEVETAELELMEYTQKVANDVLREHSKDTFKEAVSWNKNLIFDEPLTRLVEEDLYVNAAREFAEEYAGAKQQKRQ